MYSLKCSKIINETTTAGDIAYLPGGGTTIANAMSVLLKKKKAWGIQIYNDTLKEEYQMDMEGTKFNVPYQHFKAFEKEMKAFGRVHQGPRGHEFHFFSHLIKEATGVNTQELANTLESSLVDLLDNTPCKETSIALNFWNTVFPGRPDERDIHVAVSFFNSEKDLKKLMVDLEYTYEDAIGQWQMANSAIKQKRPLKLLDGFGDYKYLYGQAIKSMYHKTKLVFVSLIDMNLVPYEKIQFVGSEGVLDAIDGFQGVKVSGQEIYPKAKHFPFSVFNRLKQEIIASEDSRK